MSKEVGTRTLRYTRPLTIYDMYTIYMHTRALTIYIYIYIYDIYIRYIYNIYTHKRTQNIRCIYIRYMYTQEHSKYTIYIHDIHSHKRTHDIFDIYIRYKHTRALTIHDIYTIYIHARALTENLLPIGWCQSSGPRRFSVARPPRWAQAHTLKSTLYGDFGTIQMLGH